MKSKKKKRIVPIIISIFVCIVLLFGLVPLLSSFSTKDKSLNNTTNTTSPKGSIEIIENGTYDVKDYDSAEVNIPIPTPVLQEKTVTENGVVVPDNGFDGLSKVIISITDSKSLNVTLPEEFSTTTRVYTSALNENEILFSSNLSSVGLWLYSVDIESWQQIYTFGSSINSIQKITSTNWLLYMSNCLLSYNPETKSINLLSERTYYKLKQFSDTKWLVYTESSNSFGVYDTTTDSFKEFRNSLMAKLQFKVDDSRWLLLSGNASIGYGFGVYNCEDDSFLKLDSTALGFSYCFKISESKFILASSDYRNSLGLLLYNSNDNTFTTINSDINYVSSASQISDAQIMFCTVDSIVIYNINNDEFTSFECSTKIIDIINISEDKFMLCDSNKGISIYNINTNTFDFNIFSSFGFPLLHRVSDTQFLIGTNDSFAGGQGILLYDSSDDTITGLVNSPFSFDLFESLGDNKYLIFSSECGMQFLFDATTESISLYKFVVEQ